MKNTHKVIFLVGQKMYKNNFLGVLLEKSTQYKVFSFFSIEESLLYKGLNPTLIIHDEDSYLNSKEAGYDQTTQTFFPNYILISGEYAKVMPKVFNALNILAVA